MVVSGQLGSIGAGGRQNAALGGVLAAAALKTEKPKAGPDIHGNGGDQPAWASNALYGDNATVVINLGLMPEETANIWGGADRSAPVIQVSAVIDDPAKDNAARDKKPREKNKDKAPDRVDLARQDRKEEPVADDTPQGGVGTDTPAGGVDEGRDPDKVRQPVAATEVADEGKSQLHEKPGDGDIKKALGELESAIDQIDNLGADNMTSAMLAQKYELQAHKSAIEAAAKDGSVTVAQVRSAQGAVDTAKASVSAQATTHVGGAISGVGKGSTLDSDKKHAEKTAKSNQAAAEGYKDKKAKINPEDAGLKTDQAKAEIAAKEKTAEEARKVREEQERLQKQLLEQQERAAAAGKVETAEKLAAERMAAQQRVDAAALAEKGSYFSTFMSYFGLATTQPNKDVALDGAREQVDLAKSGAEASVRKQTIDFMRSRGIAVPQDVIDGKQSFGRWLADNASKEDREATVEFMDKLGGSQAEAISSTFGKAMKGVELTEQQRKELGLDSMSAGALRDGATDDVCVAGKLEPLSTDGKGILAALDPKVAAAAVAVAKPAVVAAQNVGYDGKPKEAGAGADKAPTAAGAVVATDQKGAAK